MRPETFCRAGEKELEKGAIHAAAVVLVGAMAAYNAVAYWYRRERRLAVNAIVYGGLTVFEVQQTWRHWQHLRRGVSHDQGTRSASRRGQPQRRTSRPGGSD